MTTFFFHSYSSIAQPYYTWEAEKRSSKRRPHARGSAEPRETSARRRSTRTPRARRRTGGVVLHRVAASQGAGSVYLFSLVFFLKRRRIERRERGAKILIEDFPLCERGPKESKIERAPCETTICRAAAAAAGAAMGSTSSTLSPMGCSQGPWESTREKKGLVSGYG